MKLKGGAMKKLPIIALFLASTAAWSDTEIIDFSDI
jgi:hypothetical protein